MKRTMKSKNKMISKVGLSATIAALFLNTLTALANDDSVAVDFVDTARVVVENLKVAEDVTLRRIDPRDVEDAIEHTKIQIELTPIKGGRHCSFAEPALKKILVYPPCFKEIARDVNRQGLVFHEYLRIMGVDDDKNQISSIYTAWMMERESERAYPSCLDLSRNPEKGTKCRTSKGVVLTYLSGTEVYALNYFTCRRWEQKVSKDETYEWSFGCGNGLGEDEDADLNKFRLAASIGVFEAYAKSYHNTSFFFEDRQLFRVSAEDSKRARKSGFYVVADRSNCKKYDSRLAYDAELGEFVCVRSEIWLDRLPRLQLVSRFKK